MKSKTTKILALTAALFGLHLIAITAYAESNAATPVVVWDHDFGTTSKMGTDGNTYTFALNGNTLQTDGSIKITGSNGAKIDISAGRENATVIIKYSNLSKVVSSKSYLLTAYTSQGFDEGLSTTDNNVLTTKGYFSTASTAYGNTYTLSEGSGYAQFAYSSGSDFYMATIPSNTAIGSGTGGLQSGLKFSNTTINGITLGGIASHMDKVVLYIGCTDEQFILGRFGHLLRWHIVLKRGLRPSHHVACTLHLCF